MLHTRVPEPVQLLPHSRRCQRIRECALYKVAHLRKYAGIAVLYIFFGVAVTPAFATDHFNLESRIPTTIEDIEPIDKGSVELQVFGRIDHMKEGKNFGETEPRIAIGIFNKTQVEISTPLLLGEGEANGNGDVAVSILRKLRDDSREERLPGFALEGDIRLPTGIEKQGFKNKIDAGLTALLKKEVGAHNIHVNAGFEWSRDESDEETLRHVVWSAVIGHHAPLTEQAVLVSDIVWRQADAKQEQDVWLVETGVRAQLTRRLIGAIGMGAGLNRGEDTPAFTLTVGFQFGL